MLRSDRGNNAVVRMDEVAELLDFTYSSGAHLTDENLVGGL